MEWITDNWKFIAIGVAVVIVLALIAYFYTQNSGFFVKQGFQNAGDGKHEFGVAIVRMLCQDLMSLLNQML